MGMTLDEFNEYAKTHDYVIFTRQQYEHVIDVFNDYELLLLDYYGRLKVDMVEMLTDLSKKLEQEPKWIPVSERLPEDHKDVLAYLSSARISICRYNSHKLPFCNNPIGWGYLQKIGSIDFEKEHVIAWMPLPTPYEPQESEDKE